MCAVSKPIVFVVRAVNSESVINHLLVNELFSNIYQVDKNVAACILMDFCAKNALLYVA